MTTPVSTAVVQFALRRTWRATAVALAVFALTLLSAAATPRPDLYTPLGLGAMFALIYAMPFAAMQFIDADRNGRLDHLRLAGHRPAQLLTSLAIGWGGPWLVFGIVGMGVWILVQPDGARTIVSLTVLVAASLAVSLLSLLLPRSGAGADPRIVAIGLAVMAVLASALQFWTDADGNRIGPMPLRVALSLLVAILILAGAGLPTVLRGTARAAVASRDAMPGLALSPTRFDPVLSRALGLCTRPAVMVALMMSAVVIVIRVALPSTMSAYSSASPFLLALSLIPLIVGAFVVSTGARGDRDTGRFELLRLTPAPPARVLAAFAIGVCIPFILATAFTQLTILICWGEQPADLRAACVAAFLIAPIAAIEGWERRWPLVYVGPAGIALILLSAAAAESLDTGKDVGDNLFNLVALGWIPWVAAVRMFRDPQAPPLKGWPSVAMSASLSLAIAPSTPEAVIGLCFALLLMVGFAVDRSSIRRIDYWGPAIVAAVITGTIAALRARPLDAAIGIVPAAGWWIGCRLHQLFSDRISIGARVLFVAAIFSLSEIWGPFLLPPPRTRDVKVWREFFRMVSLAYAGFFLVAAMLVEAVYRWRRVIPRP